MKKKPALPDRLTELDCLKMQLLRAELERARTAHRCNAARVELDKLRAQHRLLELQFAQLQAQQAWDLQTTVNDQTLAEAEAQQRSFAADIGKRYAVDWKTTGFDPATGMLMPLAKD